HLLDVRERRRALTGFGCVEQDADVVLDHAARVGGRLLQYRAWARGTHGPRGPFPALRRPIVLTPPGPLPKMVFRLSGRLAPLLVLLAVAIPTAPTATAAAPAPILQRKLARALRVPHVSPTRSAAVAVDLATGTSLYAQNAARSLAPASNEKLPITFAALSVLGPTYRFETDVVGQGGQDGTVWTGQIVLEGAGDPTLSSAGLRSLALQVRAAGIRRLV